MYKLLIVDDEPATRAGLRECFDWISCGIEPAGEADDGDVALRMAEQNRFDIVITDVRMPKMDGTLLARKLRDRDPRVKIVFVSGHDNAEYLKSAMQVSAVDYIFKPIVLRELRIVVERVVAELRMEDAKARIDREMQDKLRESMPLLRERFLLSLLEDGPLQSNRLRERLVFLSLELPVDDLYTVLVVSVDNRAEVFESRTERERQLLAYALINICQELIERHMGGYIFESQSGEFAALLYGGDGGEEKLLQLAGEIRENVERWLRISVTIGVGERAAGLANVSKAFASAREAASRKWFLGKNRVITMDCLEPLHEDGHRVSYTAMERLVLLIRAGEETSAVAVLDESFAKLAQIRQDGFVYGRNIALQIMLLADQVLLELGVEPEETEAVNTALWQQLLRQETLDELHRLVRQRVSQACSRTNERRSGKLRNLVERVQAIVAKRFADNLTVADIGKEVYLTPTYVNLLFKQETGRTINDYVTHVRMEKAKEMLRDPRLKFYDICLAVGYADASYFTKQFKKVVGMTPSVYRERLG
ncbi:response regulator [Paenibacillus cymbidii]|uniref:response regulator n=1 Tax=Paenibacillus cymbidii TaxID=1639034 RepID=UPI001080E8C5|nr:response regulator [Paenibacillus cymbidii]